MFCLLGSCQYAKLRKTAFDLLHYSFQPVSGEKVVCMCEACRGGFTHVAVLFLVHQFSKKKANNK